MRAFLVCGWETSIIALSNDQEIKRILSTFRVVAVVGMSRDVSKDSHRVPMYLRSAGYTIIPVNPFAAEVAGMRSYARLDEIPEHIAKHIEIVDIFRPSGDVPAIIEQALWLKRRFQKLQVIWMQLGITNEEAAAKATSENLTVVMDRCMASDHQRLFQGERSA